MAIYDSDQLRYPAGEDAKVLVAKRKAEDNETFFGNIKSQFAVQPTVLK
jgi:hypothetical protein